MFPICQPAVAQHRHARGVYDVPGTRGHHRRQCLHLLCQAIRVEQIITANQLEELAGREVGDGIEIRRPSPARSQPAQANPGMPPTMRKATRWSRTNRNSGPGTPVIPAGGRIWASSPAEASRVIGNPSNRTPGLAG
jgi:hypothetical protein